MPRSASFLQGPRALRTAIRFSLVEVGLILLSSLSWRSGVLAASLYLWVSALVSCRLLMSFLFENASSCFLCAEPSFGWQGLEAKPAASISPCALIAGVFLRRFLMTSFVAQSPLFRRVPTVTTCPYCCVEQVVLIDVGAVRNCYVSFQHLADQLLYADIVASASPKGKRL